MKITAIRKNRDENGSRAELFLGRIRIWMGTFFLGFRWFSLSLGLLGL
jgi:hypothetical protein